MPGSDPREAEQTAERGVRAETLLVEADHAGMDAIADLVHPGALRARIEAVFPLAGAAKGHTFGETDRTTGQERAGRGAGRKGVEGAWSRSCSR
ncbi:zinc-binding dehydrogenase [Streptomyces sp. ISL-10]|uniref:zinc-binding dehydrogenase n=1 Tax=Streptomyces sp. ISL-10 TaxID=2819172 RepID=UPI0035AC2206